MKHSKWVNLQKQKQTCGCQELGGGENQKCMAWCKASFWGDENVLELDRGDGKQKQTERRLRAWGGQTREASKWVKGLSKTTMSKLQFKKTFQR